VQRLTNLQLAACSCIKQAHSTQTQRALNLEITRFGAGPNIKINVYVLFEHSNIHARTRLILVKLTVSVDCY
jgi:hypothetical protein